MSTIVTVVVTFNRLKMLKQCIQNLRNQTLHTDILVVNNGSTDGTKEWLKDQQDLFVYHQENLGGAGGFYRGMKEAYEKGYEWIWVMDDDAFPEKKCLEKLMIFSKKSEVLAPLVVEGENIDYLHRGWFNLSKVNFPKFQIPITTSEIVLTEENHIPIDFISFIGLLVNRKVIEKIGLPNQQYFIFHDDVEYSLRIQKEGFSKQLVLNACIYHKINNDDEFFLENYIKNSPMKNEDNKNKKEIIPLFILYAIRNSIINAITYSDNKLLNKTYILLSFIVEVPRSYFKYNKFSKSTKLIWKAYFQGLMQKIDNQKLSRYY